ncbi:MAG: PP2C family protein-serine/threonine phosphatase [Acidobacteriia bacterium]|nr:PP2C family protein-serine/threonine phosphatase [Terriglobia bacterium]
MRKLLASLFFTFGALGFAIDLLLLNYQSLGRGLFWPLFSGILGTVCLAVRIKRIHLLPVPLLILVAGLWLGMRVSHTSPAWPDAAALKRRVVFDAIGILAGTLIGYRWLVAFIRTEGIASVRMQTELSLAHGIQATLVPLISFRTARFEIYGKSMPSREMGGDLIDTIESDGTLLAYVADVSGHGLAAGQLMGMLKTAIRVSRQLGQQPVAALESADRVLPAVKEPNLYATLALLCFDGSSEAEYALAGHPPILHYRAHTGDTSQLSMEQFPLGLLPGGRYSSQRVTYAAGDLFLMLTDGISEVPNAKDEDFGLARLEQLLVHNAARPLQQLCECIMTEVKHHGTQQDDQTLLLLRVLL